MNERLTKSDVFDIVFVVFGLFCLYRGVTVLTLHFFMGLIPSTESVSIIIRSLWTTGLHAILLFALAYIFLFQRKAVSSSILRCQASLPEIEKSKSTPCHLTTAFWVQMFGLYQLLNAVFAMASAFIWHLSIRMEPVSRGYLWKQLAPYTVLIVAAAILILKSKAIGEYLDKLRGACNDRLQPASGS